jgi:putative membrane protein
MMGMGVGLLVLLLIGGLILAVVVGVVVLIVTQSGDGIARRRSRAREVLDERLARGEITAEEYRQLLAEIEE